LGGFATEVATNLATKGDYDPRIANAVIDLAGQASVDVLALEARATALEAGASSQVKASVRGASTANTCAATDGGYVLNGNPTPGVVGTASAEIMASVLAGTINNVDVSSLHITITNR
jgi:hypothetical protein